LKIIFNLLIALVFIINISAENYTVFIHRKSSKNQNGVVTTAKGLNITKVIALVAAFGSSKLANVIECTTYTQYSGHIRAVSLTSAGLYKIIARS